MNGVNFKKISEKDWQQAAEKLLKGKPLKETLYSKTEEGLLLKPIYFETDQKDFGFEESRNSYIAQTLFCDNKMFNVLAKDVLQNGQTALNINLDIASRLGIDYPASEFSIRLTDYDMFRNLFDGIDTGNIAIFFDALTTGDKLFSWWLKWCRESGKDPSASTTALGVDPVSAGLIYGGFNASRDEVLNKLVSVLNDKAQFPNLDVLTIHADIVHNAGGHKIQQLVYVLELICSYVNHLMEQGVDPVIILSSLRVRMAVGNDQFMEIAKLRALRLLWQNICAAYDVEHVRLKIDAVTSWRWLSTKDRYNNMLRATGQAFSAIIGGCDSLDVLPFDLAVKAPDEFSLRQARNVQVVLHEEGQLSKVIDPSAGAYYLDNLTLDLAEKSWQAFREMQKQGGIMRAIQSGQFQAQIEANRQKQELEMEQELKKAIGVNCYELEGEKTEAEGKNYYYQQKKLYDDIKPLLLQRLL